MEVVEQIKRDGIQYNLCRLYQAKLKQDLTVKDLADLYFRGMDFCVEHDFPTVQFMKEHFKGRSEQYGVYVEDQAVKSRNQSHVVMIGDCNGELEYDGFSVSRVYIRHTSKAKIMVLGYANLSVDIYDNAQLAIAVAGSKAKVLVNVYGNAKIHSTGKVKINYKNND